MTTNQKESQDSLNNEQETFDEKLNSLFRESCHRAFLHVPELRSVVVTFDYYQRLNDAEGISKGVWLSRNGAEKTPDELMGSLGATIQSTAHIMDAGFQLYQELQNQILELSKTQLSQLQETQE